MKHRLIGSLLLNNYLFTTMFIHPIKQFIKLLHFIISKLSINKRER